MAAVGADAPFSVFRNTRRQSIVIEGDGIQLRCGDRSVELLPHVVSGYAGDIEWQGHLRGRPATVLNVICEKDVAEAEIFVGRAVEVCADRQGAIVALPICCSMSYVLESGEAGVASRGTAFVCDDREFMACHAVAEWTTGIGYIIAVRLTPATNGAQGD